MIESVVLTVTGMKCGGCEANVSKLVKELPGITEVVATHKDNTVKVSFDAGLVNLTTITETINQAGYTVA